MLIIKGIVTEGCGDFSKRIENYPQVFENETGVKLYPGTINVNVKRKIKIKEDFRIKGTLINEPNQDLIFERCKINGFPAFRIRPFKLKNGGGGHGDQILEISSEHQIPEIEIGKEVEIEFFRDI